MPLRVRLVSHMFSQQEFNKWKLNGWVVGDGAPTDAPPIAPSDPVSPNAGMAVDGGAGSFHQERLNLFLYCDFKLKIYIDSLCNSCITLFERNWNLSLC